MPLLKIYSLHGNISAGKSTLLKALEAKDGRIAVCEEDLKKWTTFGMSEENLLDLFYKKQLDPYTFQTMVVISLAEQFLKAKASAEQAGKEILICERSVYDALFIFGKVLLMRKEISQVQFDILDYLIQFVSKSTGMKFDGALYLCTDPNTASRRCASRSRPEEELVEMELLRELHCAHEELFRMEPPQWPVRKKGLLDGDASVPDIVAQTFAFLKLD